MEMTYLLRIFFRLELLDLIHNIHFQNCFMFRNKMLFYLHLRIDYDNNNKFLLFFHLIINQI